MADRTALDTALDAYDESVRKEIAAKDAQIADLRAQLAEQAPDPEPTAGVLLGIYNGGAATDDAVKTAFGVYPDTASDYYQGNQRINVAAQKARVGKGIVPWLTITTKGSGLTMASLAAGQNDGWIDQVARDVAAIGAPVFVTVEHEFEVKSNQQSRYLAGTAGGFNHWTYRPTPTIANYQGLFNRFAERVKAAAPQARVGYWFGGHDTAKIDAVGAGLRGAEWIAYDPYSTDTHPASETFEQTVTGKLAWIKGRSWYKGQPVYLGEFGSDTTHGDASVAAYMTDLRPRIAKVGLAGALLFNRNKYDPDGQYVGYKIDTGQTPKAQAAFAASLARR